MYFILLFLFQSIADIRYPLMILITIFYSYSVHHKQMSTFDFIYLMYLFPLIFQTRFEMRTFFLTFRLYAQYNNIGYTGC